MYIKYNLNPYSLGKLNYILKKLKGKQNELK